MLGRVAAALTPKPVITPESQSTRAWKVGSEGEELEDSSPGTLWTGDPELLVDGSSWRWRNLRY